MIHRLPFLLAVAVLAGCDLDSWKVRHDARDYVKPTIAVLSFQANGGAAQGKGGSGSSGSQGSSGNSGWNVGEGLAEVLTDELVKTRRFEVVERPDVAAVLSELKMQQSGVTRDEGKGQAGRLKNVEYLIRGRVTDFGHVSSNDGWVRLDMLNVFGRRYQAVLRMTFQVVEVESGRIVASQTVESSVRADQLAGEATYKGVGFGGSAFYRTPLGKVTADATRRAVVEIVTAIASRPWRPRIALLQGDQIILNGGADRGIAKGDLYRVMEHGQPIVDPETGDKLARLPGRQIGQLEIVEVHENYSVAKSLTQTTYQKGQMLEPLGK